jgi:hypothetical protein
LFFWFHRALQIKNILVCSAFFITPFANTVVACAEPSTPAAQTNEAANIDPLAILPPAPEDGAKSQDVKESAASEAAKPNARTPAASRTIPTSPGEAAVINALLEFPQPDGKDGKPTSATPAPSTPVIATAQSESLQALAKRRGLALPLPQARVVIYKAQRRLDLMSGSTLVKSYRVALGQNPVGHKQRQGDSRTPEGRFYICTRNASTSAFHIFLGLSYPALPDAKRAVNNKQITWREYQIINQRLASRGRPPWETKLGGWVGIHGGTDAAFAQKVMAKRGSRDWTAGCIALNNREIEEIYAATKLGTPVDVRP